MCSSCFECVERLGSDAEWVFLHGVGPWLVLLRIGDSAGWQDSRPVGGVGDQGSETPKQLPGVSWGKALSVKMAVPTRRGRSAKHVSRVLAVENWNTLESESKCLE